jgi:heme-degrading monooxygenase HmoA
MFARVTTAEGLGERVDEANWGLLEPVRRLAGFKHAYALLDRQRGKALTLTLWDSRQALERAEAELDRLRAEAQQAVGLSAAPTSEVYEVAIHEVGDLHSPVGMAARVTTVRGSPAEIAASIGYVFEQALPRLLGMRGFKGLDCLLDRGAGKALSIALWASEADLHASEPSVAPMRTKGAQIGGAAHPPTVEIYEVIIQA